MVLIMKYGWNRESDPAEHKLNNNAYRTELNQSRLFNFNAVKAHRA